MFTTDFELINNVIQLECNGIIYPVRVMEEQVERASIMKPVSKDDHDQWRRFGSGSTDEISENEVGKGCGYK